MKARKEMIKIKSINKKISIFAITILTSGITISVLPVKVSAAENTAALVKNDTVPNNQVVSIQGVKKAAVVWALRNGGPVLARITGVLNKDAAKVLTKNSKMLANVIDRVSAGFEGAIMGALQNVGVPHSTAKTIAWAIGQVLL